MPGPLIEFIRIQPSPALGMTHAIHVSKYEVTNAQYAAFVRATGYDGMDHPTSKEPFLGHFIDGQIPAGQELFPVCGLNWYHAQAYCTWISEKYGRTLRLPTEAEWDCIAGGEERRLYPWGNKWDPTRCNWAGPGDGFAGAAPVGSFPTGATPEGVHDLAGNNWEWCEDKRLRGGPWCLQKEAMQTTFSSDEGADQANDKFGFRLVMLDL